MKIKKILSIAFSTAICLATLTINTFAINEDYAVGDDIFLIQKNACEAHELLYNSFDWTETYIYPDDFAGDYIDYDILHILVTSDEAVNRYEKLLSKYKDNITFDIVEHSYNELFNVTENYADSISEEYDIVSYCVDVKSNKGKIGVSSEDYKKINSKPAFYAENESKLITFEIEENYRSISSEADYAQISCETMPDFNEDINMEEYYVAKTTLPAGSEIVCDAASDQVFTLGGSGTCSDYTAFVTCGHGTDQYLYVSNNGNNIGYITICQKTSGKYGDYSIIRANSNYDSTSAVLTNDQNKYFTGYMSNPAIGTYVYRYGQTTGQAYCKVSDTDVTVRPATNIRICGMTKAELISGSSAKGDSGGPFRCGTSYCGVNHGHSIINGITYLYFTPYKYLNEAGFSIATS